MLKVTRPRYDSPHVHCQDKVAVGILSNLFTGYDAETVMLSCPCCLATLLL